LTAASNLLLKKQSIPKTKFLEWTGKAELAQLAQLAQRKLSLAQPPSDQPKVGSSASCR
jgi:hypothetical protein